MKLECSGNWYLEIESKSTNVDYAIEQALEKLYYNYDGKKFFSIEINRVVIFLDRFDDPTSTTLAVMGRRYKNGSDIFLTKTIALGKVHIDTWNDYGSFYTQMKALMKVWVKLIQQDKELNPNYQW